MRLLVRAGNAAVLVADGRLRPPDGAADVVLECPDALLIPGLINAHDHLHRNHYGRLGRPPYRSAYEWARDIQRHEAALIAERHALPRREALMTGAWKNLLAGVTTVVHHDRPEPDLASLPVRVLHVPSADSLGMAPTLDGLDGSEQRYAVHLAEGVDGASAQEVRELDARGLLTDRLLAVHGVGMDADAIARFRASGAALVWCPSSNLFLFGRTAPAALLAEGVDLLLGSDSLLTAEGDLLDEMRLAASLRLVTADRLRAAVRATAARRLGIAQPTLAPDNPADVVLIRKPPGEATHRDVLLVIVGGVVRVAHPEIGARLNALLPRWNIRTAGMTVRWINEQGSDRIEGVLS